MVQGVVLHPIRHQEVSVASTSAQSAALHAKTKIVKLLATKACFVLVGADPTASDADAVSFYLPDNGEIIIAARGGLKIAAKRVTADGTLYILESHG